MGAPYQDAYRKGYSVTMKSLSVILGRLVSGTITELLDDHEDNMSLTENERKQLTKARNEMRQAMKRLAWVAKSMGYSRYPTGKKMKMRRSHEES